MERGTMIHDFRRKVMEEKSKISDREFFLSEQCQAYLQNLAEAVCKIYKSTINLILKWEDSGIVAFATDRYQLVLNINNQFFHTCKSRVEKLVVQKGITLHECGHLLFTDFHLQESAQKVFLQNRKLFPEPRCEEYKQWLTDINSFDDHALSEWLNIWARLANSIEDGFVEHKILALIPGEGQCLLPLRKMQLERIEPFKIMKSKGIDNSAILFNSILCLAKYGTVKMDSDDTTEPAIAALLSCYDTIQRAVRTEKSYDRMKLINELFCILYRFMKEDREKEASSPEANKDHEKTDDNQQGDSDPHANNADRNETSPETTEDNDRSALPSPSSLLEQAPEEINDRINTGSGSVLNDKNINQEKINPSRNNDEKLSSILQNNSDQTQSQRISSGALQACSSIEESIASQKVNADYEKLLAENLKAKVCNFNFSPINDNIPILIERNPPTSAARKVYERDMEDIHLLVSRTVREIRRKIKDRQQGGKINGLYQGRYLDQNSLYRYDLRLFCKNDLPEDIPNMAFCIVIDASGSMSGLKLEYARKTALLLYHLGLALGIPVMVYSHNTDSTGSTVTMQALADFNSVDGNDKFRICDLREDGYNRDGMALRFCSERLSCRREPDKICFVISDGLPSCYTNREEGAQDIRNVLLDYARKHVRYVAFGLGNDQARIEELYTQGMTAKTAARFIRTDEPSSLPKTVVNCIRSLINAY